MRNTLLCLTFAALPAALGAWETAAPGSPDHATLMDVIRPHAEWILGAPLVFRVNELRVDGAVAYGLPHLLRSDGSAVGPKTSPGRDWA
ncbi:hypothetical protein [Ponticoccus alexandrii]|uniref:Uncharacterized protein n=1 Tax=Ponticoccus alexandrii TaxID=1943633 RepID=A0ABX7F656_9RHOB|nr:hypothetical protein [Ponticoccus alexandrii]ETA52611.1 hypothetical protein P279_07790 [Rhodobacteraceae bacterium PD-2]QRF65594.1 hypothetical protein GQA70_04215 [Ponticoccus alexandrii]